MYQELTGVKKPVLDKNSILHWPVLLLYAEVMSSDFIEDFCETDMFSTHLDMISFLASIFFLNIYSYVANSDTYVEYYCWLDVRTCGCP